MKSIKIDRLVNLMGRSHIRVYTYQGPEAFENYKKNGFFSGNAEYIDKTCDWPEAYSWMRSQMELRIPGFTGDYPIWAWPKRPSAKTKLHKLQVDEKYRITALVPAERILPSDYDLWHSPLNNFAVTKTEAEFDTYTGDPKPTWDRIFDFSPYENNAAFWRKGDQLVSD